MIEKIAMNTLAYFAEASMTRRNTDTSCFDQIVSNEEKRKKFNDTGTWSSGTSARYNCCGKYGGLSFLSAMAILNFWGVMFGEFGMREEGAPSSALMVRA